MNKMLSAISLSFIFFLIGCTVPTSTSNPTHTPARAIKNMPTAPIFQNANPSTITPTRTPARAIKNMPTASIFQNVSQGVFNFISMGDGQAETVSFTATVNQISTLHPELVIINGDLGYTGVVSTEMDPMVAALKKSRIIQSDIRSPRQSR